MVSLEGILLLHEEDSYDDEKGHIQKEKKSCFGLKMIVKIKINSVQFCEFINPNPNPNFY